MLEDHPYLLAPDLPELLGWHIRDVLAIQVDFPLCRFDETVDRPQERGLSASREPDDHEDLTRPHLEVSVVYPMVEPVSFSTSALFFPERRISSACRALRPKTTEQLSTRMIGS